MYWWAGCDAACLTADFFTLRTKHRFFGGSVWLELRTEAEAEDRSSPSRKPKPNRKTDGSVRFRFGSVRFSVFGENVPRLKHLLSLSRRALAAAHPGHDSTKKFSRLIFFLRTGFTPPLVTVSGPACHQFIGLGTNISRPPSRLLRPKKTSPSPLASSFLRSPVASLRFPPSSSAPAGPSRAPFFPRFLIGSAVSPPAMAILTCAATMPCPRVGRPDPCRLLAKP